MSKTPSPTGEELEEAKKQGKKEGKVEVKNESKKEPKTEVNPETKKQAKAEVKGEIKKQAKVEVKGEIKKQAKAEIRKEPTRGKPTKEPTKEPTKAFRKETEDRGKDDKKQQIVKAIEGMNVLELSELVKELEDRFGVSATAVSSVGIQAPNAAGEAAVEEEQIEFDAVLSEVGGKKIQVIKEVRKVTSLGLKEAKDLVEQAPKPVKQGVSKEEALKIKEILEAVGAKVEVK